MRNYSKITVTVKHPVSDITHNIEVWSENGHSSVYVNDSPFFDGASCEAHNVIKNEVERVAQIADNYGCPYTVDGRF